MTGGPYEVYAIQYARSMRPSRDFFLGEDPHNGPRPIFYYVWLIRNAERTILVDTGFNAERAARRQRELIRCPTEGLAKLGVNAGEIDTVILTHLHYDHAGNLDKFPRAEFLLQDEEMRYATGRAMRFKLMRAAFEVGDVLAVVAHNYEGRVRFISGVEEIAPGIVLHHVPGHTRGLQAVTVETARGRLCLASDTAHFYDNILHENPFPVIADVAATLDGHEKVQRLAQSPDHLIPGHDPRVMELFPKHPADPLTCDLAQPPLSPTPLSAGSSG
jgi:glyoxylase-like metal-dependent hydrolase (beta-lactamase superfamily II)